MSLFILLGSLDDPLISLLLIYRFLVSSAEFMASNPVSPPSGVHNFEREKRGEERRERCFNKCS